MKWAASDSTAPALSGRSVQRNPLKSVKIFQIHTGVTGIRNLMISRTDIEFFLPLFAKK